MKLAPQVAGILVTKVPGQHRRNEIPCLSQLAPGVAKVLGEKEHIGRSSRPQLTTDTTHVQGKIALGLGSRASEREALGLKTEVLGGATE